MKVQARQSVIDIAIKECGSVEAALPIAIANSISITDDLTAGQELIIPSPINQAVVNYYNGRNIKPATQVDAPSGISIFDETFDETFE